MINALEVCQNTVPRGVSKYRAKFYLAKLTPAIGINKTKAYPTISTHIVNTESIVILHPFITFCKL